MSVEIPSGYDLVQANGKAYNFAAPSESYCLFLACRTSNILLGWPIPALGGAAAGAKESFGLIDNFDTDETAAATTVKPEDLADELKELGKSNVPELYFLLNTLQTKSIQLNLKSLFVSLLRKNPERLMEIVTPDTFFDFMNCLSDDLSILTRPFKQILATSSGQNLASMMFNECVFQLIMASTVAA
jgi:hypothetical protein